MCPGETPAPGPEQDKQFSSTKWKYLKTEKVNLVLTDIHLQNKEPFRRFLFCSWLWPPPCWQFVAANLKSAAFCITLILNTI